MNEHQNHEDAETIGSAARVGPLKTSGNVATELGRLYRATRRGKVDTLDASRLAGVLGILRQTLESDEFERRLEKVEQLTKGRP